jgi:putative transposase
VGPICAALDFPASTYYAAKKRECEPSARARRDEALKEAIWRVWDQPGPGNRVYGADKIWRELNRRGVRVARCTVERLMRDLGISGVGTPAKRPRTTVADPAASRPGDLLERDFSAAAPNTRWVADITYVPTQRDGWCYTAFIMDCYSRAVVGWACWDHMRTELVLNAFEMAVWARKPHLRDGLVHHSDRGSQYTSICYTDRLAELGVARSVGSKGDSYDNAAAESLNSLYKRELIDRLGPWNDLAEVTRVTMEWVAWYNSERLHSYCQGAPPFEYEESFHRSHTSAA